MPLVDAKCTSCGGILKVDNNKEAAVCSYCGCAYIVEKAINNYYVTNNNTTVINATNLNVGSDSVDQLFDAGMKCINANNFELACDYFTKLEEKYPSDYRGTLGRLLVYTQNWSVLNATIDNVKKEYEKLRILAPEDKFLEIKVKYDAFSKSVQLEKIEEDKMWARRMRHVCQHCGGSFKGIWIKKCSRCGIEKDYI